jgi:hypothetical protein
VGGLIQWITLPWTPATQTTDTCFSNVALDISQLNVLRTELTHAVLEKMSEQDKRCYLYQVIYNKYANLGASELRSECKKVLDDETNLAIDTAFRFQDWMRQKYS